MRNSSVTASKLSKRKALPVNSGTFCVNSSVIGSVHEHKYQYWSD